MFTTQGGGGSTFEQIRNGLRTTFKCLTKSNFESVSRKFVSYIDKNVLSLLKIVRHLLELKHFEAPRELIYVLIRISIIRMCDTFYENMHDHSELNGVVFLNIRKAWDEFWATYHYCGTVMIRQTVLIKQRLAYMVMILKYFWP